MKKILLASTLFLLIFLIAPRVNAATWKDKYDVTEPYMAGTCYMVDQQSEADATHVYTLNPDNTYELNQSYYKHWYRDARCDELQFHVDHNTPLARLNAWLDEVAYGWYANLSATHYNHQTVSTSRHEWFYVDENGIHRIPDWLTAMSWGLLTADRLSIPEPQTNRFYELVTIAAPLNFNDGKYADKINDIWKNHDRDFSTLPSKIASEINSYTFGYHKIFTSCPTSCGGLTDRWCGSLFDWRWVYDNPGYDTCPANKDRWRSGNSEEF